MVAVTAGFRTSIGAVWIAPLNRSAQRAVALLWLFMTGGGKVGKGLRCGMDMVTQVESDIANGLVHMSSGTQGQLYQMCGHREQC